jgi:hypothetical protein
VINLGFGGDRQLDRPRNGGQRDRRHRDDQNQRYSVKLEMHDTTNTAVAEFTEAPATTFAIAPANRSMRISAPPRRSCALLGNGGGGRARCPTRTRSHYVNPAPAPIADFTLTDQSGQPRISRACVAGPCSCSSASRTVRTLPDDFSAG